MNKNILFVVFLLNYIFAIAQSEKIELPKSDYEKRISSTRVIYIYENETILLEKDTVSLNDLRIKLFTTAPPQNIFDDYSVHNKTGVSIQLVADKDIPYRLIDAVKTEIASTERADGRIVYRTGSLKEGEYKRMGKGLKFKLFKSFFRTTPTERLYSRKYLKRLDSIEKKNKKIELLELQRKIRLDSIMPSPPAYDDPVWENPNLAPRFPYPFSYNYERVAYSINKKVIEDRLKGKKRKCLTIHNDGIKDHNNVKISNLEFKEIASMIENKNNRILFVYTSDDLTYQNYLKFVEVQQELMPFDTYIDGYRAEMIEISHQMKQLHNSMGIKLCD